MNISKNFPDVSHIVFKLNSTWEMQEELDQIMKIKTTLLSTNEHEELKKTRKLAKHAFRSFLQAFV